MEQERYTKTSIRLPEELHWRFQATRVDRRVSITAAVQQAVEAWIDNAAGQSMEPGAHPHRGAHEPEIIVHDSREREWAMKLLAYLRENRPHKEETEKLLRAVLGVEDAG